jgi:hypothetical protein
MTTAIWSRVAAPIGRSPADGTALGDTRYMLRTDREDLLLITRA